MIRRYAAFYNAVTERLQADGGEFVCDVPPKYRELRHNGHRVLIPLYLKYAFVVYYGELTFFTKCTIYMQAMRHFEKFLTDIANDNRQTG